MSDDLIERWRKCQYLWHNGQPVNNIIEPLMAETIEALKPVEDELPQLATHANVPVPKLYGLERNPNIESHMLQKNFRHPKNDIICGTIHQFAAYKAQVNEMSAVIEALLEDYKGEGDELEIRAQKAIKYYKPYPPPEDQHFYDNDQPVNVSVAPDPIKITMSELGLEDEPEGETNGPGKDAQA